MPKYTLALFYSCFTFLFVYVNLNSQDTETKADIYTSIVQGYNLQPWQFQPTKYLVDIHTQQQLHNWITTVFVPNTFREQPVNGAPNGFCTKNSPCYDNEGDCDDDEQCMGNSTCGDKTASQTEFRVNGEYWSKEDLQTYCNYMGTPVDIASTVQNCEPAFTLMGTEPPCCIDMKGIAITRLEPYASGTAPVVRSNCPNSLPMTATCCARPSTDPVPITTNSTPAHKVAAFVGNFNQIFMIRMTLKRYQLEKNTKGKFKSQVPEKVKGKGARISAKLHAPYLENKSAICSPQGNCWNWYKNGSYNGAGGYTVFIDPQDGQLAAEQVVNKLSDNGWFDQTTATFTLDMITFNQNLDMFMQVVWSFEFDFAGGCDIHATAQGFNLNLFNNDVSKYAIRFYLEVLLLICVLIFAILELKKIYELTPQVHFKRLSSYVDFVSLLLCTISLANGWIISSSSVFTTFKYEQLTNPATRSTTYTALEDVANAFGEQTYIVALNLLCVFIRAVVLVAQLQTNLGLMLRILDAGVYNMMYFVLMFLMIMTGFVLFAYFTFGAGYIEMRAIMPTFYQIFAMLLGKEVFPALAAADATMAPIFFYFFYVFFSVIMTNMFLSILLSAYDVVSAQIKEKQEEDRKSGIKEENPFMELKKELEQNIYNPMKNCVMFSYKIAKAVITPILSACGDCASMCPRPSLRSCLECCGPCCPDLRAWNRTTQRSSTTETETAEKTKEPEPVSAHTKRKEKNQEQQAQARECIVLGCFMLLFIIFMTLQTRGQESYWTAQATSSVASDTSWREVNPERIESFASVKTFESVGHWSIEFAGKLYDSPMCATQSGADVPIALCDNTNPDQQIVQIVNSWNHGFLNTTFVRVTIQPACFQSVSKTKFFSNKGSTLTRSTPSIPCATASCSEIATQNECKLWGGEQYNVRKLYVNTLVCGVDDEFCGPNAEKYNYSAKGIPGSYKELGGIVIGLGVTKQQAVSRLQTMIKDDWFTKNSASMVFDWVTYNGNYDMFTHNSVMFSLLPTGSLSVKQETSSFPFNILQGGGWFRNTRIAIFALFLVYVLLVLYFTIDLVWQLVQEYRKAKQAVQEEGGSAAPYRCIVNFYSNFWNISDTLSLAISIVSIVNWATYTLTPFRRKYEFRIDPIKAYQVPNPDVKRFGMVRDVNPIRDLEDDWYIFYQFQRLSGLYDTFLTIAALNSFFISIKVVKYVGQLEKVKVFSDTLNTGKNINIYFSIIIFMLLSGFALFYNIIFGPTVTSLKSMPLSILTLFGWMIGDFDLSRMLEVNLAVAIITFMIFTVIFYFVSINMFLATMMNTYSDSVSERDTNRERDKIARNRKPINVNYKDRKALKDDLKAKKDEKNEWVVDQVTNEGNAADAKVQVGFRVPKVGNEYTKQAWNKFDTWEDVLERYFVKDGSKVISLTFVEPSGKKDFMYGGWAMVGAAKDEDTADANVPATVRSFWRPQGAVTIIARRAGMADKSAEDDDADDNASSSDEDGMEEEAKADDDKGRGHDTEATTQAIKLKTKKKLDNILFSRWTHGKNRYDATENIAARTASSNEKEKTHWEWAAANSGDRDSPGGAENENSDEDNDVNSLRERIETIEITGEETWLDCLITAIEKEMDGESIVTDVLRTNDMSEGRSKQSGGSEKKPMQEFNKNADEVLKILEYKAQKKYYAALKVESEQRQGQLDKQNQVLHDYVCELEREFTKIMERIHSLKGKKSVMMRKLAVLLDEEVYRFDGDNGYGKNKQITNGTNNNLRREF